MRVSTLVCAAALLASTAAAQPKVRSHDESLKPKHEATALLPGSETLTVRPLVAGLLGGGLSEDFEGVADGGIPSGWTRFEAGSGLTQQWGVLSLNTETSAGIIRVVRSRYEVVASGQAIDYLVTPQVAIGTGWRLRARLAEQYTDGEYGSQYEVRLSTGAGSSASDFSIVLGTYAEADLPSAVAEGLLDVSFDLSAYEGQSVYIAFVHTNANGDNFIVDDVVIEPTPAGPVIAVGPASIAFGDVLNGETATETVTISNTGGADLTISSITVAGASFTLDQTGTATTVAPNGSTTFDVTFSPTADGEYSGTVTVASDAPGSPTEITLSGAGVTPPANDDMASATEISGPGTYTGSNAFATVEAEEPAPSCNPDFQGASVWWAYTATRTGSLSLDFSSSSYDTVVSLHEMDGNEIACDDDGGTTLFTSRILGAPITDGTTYLIRVAGYTDPDAGTTEQGDISFTAIEADAYVTTTASGSITTAPTFSRPQADGDGTAGSCEATEAGYGYDMAPLTVDETGTYQITVEWDDPLDGYLLLYEGTFGPGSPCVGLIGRNDDQFLFDGSSSALTATLTAGAPYVLVFTSFDPNETGTYNLSIFGPGAVGFETAAEETPETTTRVLGNAHPNPTAVDVRFSMSLATAESVRLTVHDLLGREVAVLHDGPLATGETIVTASMAGLPAGRYLVRAVGETFAETRSLTVVR